ncbi:MAG: DALR anticodon-binding domain-containing protein, partial [Vampirovibrionales bacterium]|nr:DALR anticodon-binding domain-containing protein [Vampirovibrionales bacterium]
YTYLLPDIAYHLDKFRRSRLPSGAPYSQIVNIWGADHHGYVARMRAALIALGILASPETSTEPSTETPRFEVLLGQLVSLKIDGESTRMGKRKKMLTLQDLVDTVGTDATRYWMVMRSADSQLEFDVALATKQSDDNPVFYAQYAHARCCGILRAATQPSINIATQTETKPQVKPEVFETYLSTLTPEKLVSNLFAPLTPPKTINAVEAASTDEAQNATTTQQANQATEATQKVLRQLVLKLDALDDCLSSAAETMAPHHVPQYISQLASNFHGFYAHCRVLTDEADVTLARLALVTLVARVLARALDVIGVHAPERM